MLKVRNCFFCQTTSLPKLASGGALFITSRNDTKEHEPKRVSDVREISCYFVAKKSLFLCSFCKISLAVCQPYLLLLQFGVQHLDLDLAIRTVER